MIAENTSAMANGPTVVAEKPVAGSMPTKKNQGKVPKKIHKAEREKLKRDNLNELFQELAHALEPDRQSNGKASILGDTSRILRDLFAQVESLRKENAALQTESRYVTVEKNELRDENTALQGEISELKNDLRARMQSEPAWSNSPGPSPPTLPQPVSAMLPLQQQQQPPIIGPMIAPLQELQLFPEARTTAESPRPCPQVSRPHARYPSPTDAWPTQLLSSLPRAAEQQSSSRSTSTSNSRDESLDKA